jgi:acetoacetyl-CoA synthetase
VSLRAPLWRPSAPGLAAAELTRFVESVSRKSGSELRDYSALHRWSVDQPGEFWRSVWEFCDVRGQLRGPSLVSGAGMRDARWFPEARLNYAENLLRRRDSGTALVFWGEDKVRRSLTWDELYRDVAAIAGHLRALGVVPGDRVGGYLPNMPEATIAMLGAASIGAVWSSCSPDFGSQGVLERFGQIAPKVLFACDGYWFNGQHVNSMERVREVVRGLPSLVCTVIVPYAGGSVAAESIPGAVDYPKVIAANRDTELSFESLPFDHPLFILYSSGTTGVPKCIVHGAGGTLLQHLKEHRLHTDVKAGDRLFYATTCGWMMWNWLMSGLASEATLVLYDGSPLVGHGSILFDLADAAEVTHFGTSARFVDTAAKLGLSPMRTHRLNSLRAVLSTGSPLVPESFDYVYREIKSDVCLSSISGGTDIVSCFVLGSPTLPVWRGEIQCLGLGLSVEVFDAAGRPVVGEKGELVCTRPFPSMPVRFWNDPDGAKYASAYFGRFPGVWCHGDYVEMTERDGVRGMIIYGRSDATLKPGGVRIGTAEIYRQVEQLQEVSESLVIGQEWQNDTRIVLFVKLREGLALNSDLTHRIRERIRHNASPAHVPAKILQVTDIPRTKSNKIVELAVRDVVHDRVVRNREALANPEALEQFRNRVELSEAQEEGDASSVRVPVGGDCARPVMHGLEWVERRLSGAALPLDFLAPLEHVRECVQATARDFPDQAEELCVVENLSLEYVREAFDAIGATASMDAGDSADALATRLEIATQHHKLFGRLVHTLAAASLHSNTVEHATSKRVCAAQLASKALRTLPHLQHEIALISRCGGGLAEVLKGTRDPLELLFPDGAAKEMAALYKDSPTFGLPNALVPKALNALIGSLPGHRGLRILELGAGTGGTTAHLLPRLGGKCSEYFVTDVGAAFLSHARESFGQYPFVRYGVFDVEKSPEAQGWQGGVFDLVIAANALHATADLTQTLRNVRQVLKPGGALVLLEGSAPRLWLDITFGLTEGWSRFKDSDLRPVYALLTPEQWRAPLRAAGFSEVTSGGPSGAMIMAQSIIVARAGSDAAEISSPPRSFLVIAAHRDPAAQLAANLRARGHQCDTRVLSDEGHAAGAVRSVVAQALTRPPSVDGLICLFDSEARLDSNLPATAVMQAAQQACTTILDVVHELQNLQAKQLPQPTLIPRLWLITQDCTSVSGSRLSGLAQAPVRGLALAIAQEHPDMRCAHVDVERVPSQATLQALCDELVADSPEDRIAYRSGIRSALRLTPWTSEPRDKALRLSAHSTYLITGGLGQLGLFFAQWLVQHGARHLALIGRREPTAQASDALDRLRALGANLHVARVDIADSAEVATCFRRFAAEAPPIAGVIHAAGVLDDALLRDQRWERFAPVLAPKVAGAWNLHLATRELRLEFFAMFSSTAAVLGHGGQANHAAANAFLDSLSYARRAAGLPAVSINWGPWARIGAASNAAILERLGRQGIRPLAPELGLSTLSDALAAQEAQVVVAAVQWPEFERARGRTPFVERLRAGNNGPANTATAFHSRLDAAPAESRREMLSEYVRAEVAGVLGLEDPDLIDIERGFFELGMDSLSSIQLRNRLQRGLGRALPSTLAFDYPNVAALVRFLFQEVYPEAHCEPASVTRKPFAQDSTTAAALTTVSEDTDAAIAEELAELEALLRPYR